MKDDSLKPKLFGLEITQQQLGVGLLVLAGLLVTLSCFGQTIIVIAVLIVVCTAILLWGIQLHELSESPADNFSQLRQLAKLRRQREQNEQGEQTLRNFPFPLLIPFALIVAAFCASHLLKARYQYAAKDYPSVMGMMTRYENVDIGMVSSQLEVEYEYVVGGQKYHGNRFRFLKRPYRVGTDDAKKLAARWGQGNGVRVFYHPDKAANSAIDNTFCKGDQLFIGLNVLGLLAAIIVCLAVCYFCFLRKKHRPPHVSIDPVSGRAVLRLSNTPLYGTLAFMIAGVSFGLLLTMLFGGMLAMGSGPIPWLVKAIDWMYVVTGGLLVASVICFVVERICYGRGRTCEVDSARNQIFVKPEGLAEQKTIDMGKIESIKIVSNREDWFKFGRTFSLAIFFRDKANELVRIVLQRERSRRRAVDLLASLRNLIKPAARQF
jgi:hypothetical protein